MDNSGDNSCKKYPLNIEYGHRIVFLQALGDLEGKTALGTARLSFCLTDENQKDKIEPSPRRRAARFKMLNCSYSNAVDFSGAPAASSTPFAFASSTCAEASTTMATTSDVVILPTMTAGDILVATMIFFALIFAVIYSLAKALWPIEVWASRKQK